MKHNQEHMDLIRKFSILLGMWPVKLSGWRSRAYKMYTHTIIVMYCLFVLSLLIKLLEIIGKDFKEMDKSLSVVFPVCFLGYRYIICRSQPIQECIIMIYDLEKKYLQLADEGMKKIHYAYKCYSNKITVMFLSSSVGILFFVLKPIVHNMKYYKSFNETTDDYKFDMMYQTWLPFNENKHHILTFFIHLIVGKQHKIKMKL